MAKDDGSRPRASDQDQGRRIKTRARVQAKNDAAERKSLSGTTGRDWRHSAPVTSAAVSSLAVPLLLRFGFAVEPLDVAGAYLPVTRATLGQMIYLAVAVTDDAIACC